MLLRIAGVALLLLAAPAFADDHHHSGGGGSASCDACGPGLAVTLGVVDAAFFLVDVVLLAKGSNSAGWGTAQLIWGLGHGLLGIILTPLGALGVALKTDGSAGVLSAGIIILVVAVLMITYGIKSIIKAFRRDVPAVEGGPPVRPAEKQEERPAERPADQDFVPMPPPPSSLTPSESSPTGTFVFHF